MWPTRRPVPRPSGPSSPPPGASTFFELNLFGPMRLASAALPTMLAQGGLFRTAMADQIQRQRRGCADPLP